MIQKFVDVDSIVLIEIDQFDVSTPRRGSIQLFNMF